MQAGKDTTGNRNIVFVTLLNADQTPYVNTPLPLYTLHRNTTIASTAENDAEVSNRIHDNQALVTRMIYDRVVYALEHRSMLPQNTWNSWTAVMQRRIWVWWAEHVLAQALADQGSTLTVQARPCRGGKAQTVSAACPADFHARLQK